MFALISNDELEEMGQILVKQLKNRYNDHNNHKKFVVGIDRAKMRLFDVEQSAQNDVLESEPTVSYNENMDKLKTKTFRRMSLTNAKKVNFNEYSKFVDAVTSDESKDFIAFSDRIVALDEKGANIERLLTGAVGINAEGGEVMEIVKKLIFQGKPWDDQNIYHLKRELGDVMWYVMQCLIALDSSMDEIVGMNVEKLKARYPGGEFDPFYSENRQEGDL